MRGDVPDQAGDRTLLPCLSGSPEEKGSQEVHVGKDTDDVHTRFHQKLGTLLPVAFRTPAGHIFGGPPQGTLTG